MFSKWGSSSYKIIFLMKRDTLFEWFISFKGGPSPSKNVAFICFNNIPLKW